MSGALRRSAERRSDSEVRQTLLTLAGDCEVIAAEIQSAQQPGKPKPPGNPPRPQPPNGEDSPPIQEPPHPVPLPPAEPPPMPVATQKSPARR